MASARRKTCRVLVAGLVVSASPAMAADAPPVVDWAGLYLGASFGAGFPMGGGRNIGGP
jgi:hypothetical protein